MSQIKAVVFDIGNVLIGWQPEQYFDRIIGEERRRAMFEAVDLHAMNDRVDRGENLMDVVAETAPQYPAYADEIRMWGDHWIDLTGPVIDHSVRLLRALRANDVTVFALSNFGRDTFEMAEPVYPFLTEFDRRYISGHMKCIKPDPQIYQMVEADCGLAPSDLLFTDDRQDNIDMALSRGWHAHRFTHARGFADRLVAEGLLTMEDAQ
ncbi:HAD family hydrolase [Yoonia sp. 208BN28-4]|uniref:HAD family hydrolase n=1 Tax=Yoonia sp. 208BN28-4 TaxID=3126505 RepID=UPI0030B52622